LKFNQPTFQPQMACFLRNFSAGKETLGQDVSLGDADVGKVFGFQQSSLLQTTAEKTEATSNEASLAAVDNADVLLKPAG